MFVAQVLERRMRVGHLETAVQNSNTEPFSINSLLGKSLSFHQIKLFCELSRGGGVVLSNVGFDRGGQEITVNALHIFHKRQRKNIFYLESFDCQRIEPSAFAHHLLRKSGSLARVLSVKREVGGVAGRKPLL